MIPVTSETSPSWNYNHAHQRTQEVRNLTLLHKDRVGSCQKPTKNSKLPFHPNIAKSHETEGIATIKKQGPMLVAFH